MKEREKGLTEEQARQLWQRAAELQQAAETPQLTDGEAGSASVPDAANQVPFDVARRAAVESGIDPRFVDDAELRLAVEQFLDAENPSRRRALQPKSAVTSVSSRLAASPDTVQSALIQTTQTEAYSAEVIEIIEREEGRRGFAFELSSGIKTLTAEGSFHYQVLGVADVKRFAVLLSPGADGETEVVVHARLDRSSRINGIAMRVIQSIGLLVATGVGFQVGAGAATAFLGGGIGLAVGVGVWWGVGKAYRAAYQKGLKNVQGAFKKLINAVRLKIESSS